MPAKSLKAADKATILKKLTTEMKRRYGGSIPKQTRPAFETLLFGICLEDTSHDEAETAYASLLEPFFDLNEIRVSSITQIQEALGPVYGADWKALRIREALQYIFEKHYAFDMEYLKRKTQEQAVKELAQIPYQTPFVRGYLVQHLLGAHVIPVDQSILKLLQWLGLASDDSDPEAAGEEIKAGIKKAEGVQLCHLLKCTSVDPELRPHFDDGPDADEALDPFAAGQRLAELFKNPQKKKKKAAKPAPPAKAAPAAKPAAQAKPAPAAGKAVAVKKPVKKVVERAAVKSKAAVAPRKATKKAIPTPKKKTNRKRG